MQRRSALTILALGATLLAGCAGAGAAGGGTVKADLTDMRISLDRTSVPAGAVTFVVANHGAVAHELVVLKTDVAQDKVKADAAEPGRVDETGNLGETGDMDAGSTKTFTVSLPAGHYVLICNEVGHYASGMHLAFTVN